MYIVSSFLNFLFGTDMLRLGGLFMHNLGILAMLVHIFNPTLINTTVFFSRKITINLTLLCIEICDKCASAKTLIPLKCKAL